MSRVVYGARPQCTNERRSIKYGTFEAWVEKVRVSLNPRRSVEGGSLNLRIVDLHGWFVAVGHLRYFDHRESMLLVVGGTYL